MSDRRAVRPIIRALPVLALVVLATGWWQPPIPSVQTTPSSRMDVERLVAAYYFYWYNVYTGQHFVDPDYTDALTDHPPDAYLSNYSWTEVAWHRRELLDMIAAGIDIALPVYWGSSQEAYWSVPGLQNLVAAEQQLIGEGITPPRIGMFYDTAALQQQSGGVKPDLTTPTGKRPLLWYGRRLLSPCSLRPLGAGGRSPADLVVHQ